MLPDDAWVALAEVARPHGVRGEVRLRLYNRDSDLLLEQDDVLVRFPRSKRSASTALAAQTTRS